MEVKEMKTLSLSEAKMKLSGLVELVKATDEEVVITKNGRPAAVLVSPEEFESWKETIAVRSDTDLMKEIRKGLKAYKTGKVSERTTDELFE
jgi:prevent-host-death family protein